LQAVSRLHDEYLDPETGMAFDIDGLYRTTYDSVVRFLYRKVWDADRAEDLAQEVFMRALAHEPEKPRSWVFAVAANIARDEARSAIRKRKHLVLMTHEPMVAPSPNDDVAETMDHAEQEAEVKRALEMLSPRDRDVLLLWDAGLSYPEIAEQTHLALGAVGTTLARARKRLVEAHDSMEAERGEKRRTTARS